MRLKIIQIKALRIDQPVALDISTIKSIFSGENIDMSFCNSPPNDVAIEKCGIPNVDVEAPAYGFSIVQIMDA